MSEHHNQRIRDLQGEPKYVVICINDFCNRYSIRKGIRNKFGLYNEVQSIDEESFERLKSELRCAKRNSENMETQDGLCKKQHYEVENSLMEGSTLEVPSQDLLYSQDEEVPPELIVSEDIGLAVTQGGDARDASMTLLESENNGQSQEAEPELLQSDEFYQVISSPGA